MIRAEELFSAGDGEVFDHINMLASAIPAFAWVAFCIFISEDASLSFHYGWISKVFGGDELDVVLLALALSGDGGSDLRVDFRDRASVEGGTGCDGGHVMKDA
jgi:hypothetical protein